MEKINVRTQELESILKQPLMISWNLQEKIRPDILEYPIIKSSQNKKAFTDLHTGLIKTTEYISES